MSAVEFNQAFLHALQYGEEGQQLILDSLNEARDRAKSLAPVRTGHLRDSIDYELGVDAEGVYGDLGFGADAFYGRFIELGTVKMPPHPFLRPAVT